MVPKVTSYVILFIKHSLNDKIIEIENRLLVAMGLGSGWGQEGRVAIKKGQHDYFSDRNVLYPEYINVNILVVILHYNFQAVGGHWVKGTRISLCIISCK